MDTYENNPFPQEPTDSQSAAAQPEKQESPFADSPYVRNDPFEYNGQSQWQSPPAPPQPPKKKSKAPMRIVACLLAVALVAAGCGITAACVNSYWEARNQTAMDQLNQKIAELQEQIRDNSYTGNGNSISGSTNVSAEGMTPAQVYAKNVGSVVAITSTVTSNNFGQVAQSVSYGSGFIISEDGYVVTNHHVIEGGTKLTVTIYDGTEYSAELIGSDSANDVALLKVDATGLQAAAIGSSSDLIVGDQVAAIGNPLGELTSTLTVGYVSAKDRTVTTDGTIINMLQTDAAINSGNSGGPLFNMKGEVVGITTAKYSGTSSSGATIEGIGFAIPIDDVAKILADLKEHGYVTGAYLGVYVRDMDTGTANAYGLPMGAYVEDVTDGYCAKEAGVRAKDIIVDVGGYEVDSINALTRALQNFEAGDTTVITVWRAGNFLELDITLDEKPQTQS